MFDKLKEIGKVGGALFFWILLIILGFFLLRGVALFVGAHQDLIALINTIAIALILLLFVLSIIPKLRIFSGMGIVYVASVWIFLYWLNCLAITYGIWGPVGAFIGIALFGFGVFATAILSSLVSGQWIGSIIIIAILSVMFGVRFLGALIASKRQALLELKYIQSLDEDLNDLPHSQ